VQQSNVAALVLLFDPPMIRSKYLAVLFLLPQTLWAAEASISLSQAMRCSSLLSPAHQEAVEAVQNLVAQVLPSVVSGGSIEGNLGVLGELPNLMRASGAKSATILYATRLVSTVLSNNSGKDSPLGNTASRLDRFEVDEKSLLICVLSKGCRLTFGNAIHLAINPNFEVVPFNTVPGASTKPGWAHVEGLPMESVPRIIIMNGGPNLEAVTWATNFLHEATHFADFELIGEWIEANLKLLKNRGMPDEIFTNYVRISSTGDKIRIDEGFLRIFLESRAYAAEVSGFSNLVQRAFFLTMQREQRRRTIEDIQSFKTVTESAAEKLNISEQNIFEVGERMGRIMNATIAAQPI
jgi:hypothetical protein